MTSNTQRLVGLIALALLGSASARAAERTWNPRLLRQVLAALTPEQAAAFAAGADASAVLVEDGKTLDQVIAAAVAETSVELAYTPVDPCALVRTAGAAAGALLAGETRAFRARGSLSAQGGAVGGCGVPDDARAIAVIARVAGARGKGSLRIWPAGDPEPAIGVLDYVTGGGGVLPALVELCQGPSCTADFQVHALGAATHIRLDVVGYFAPFELTTGPKGDPGAPGAPGPPGPRGEAGPPGVGCSVTTFGGDATLSCPDGTSVSWPLGSAPPPPPPAGLSFQVVSPDIQVDAGITKICYYFRTPNTQTVAIHGWASQMSSFVRELRVFVVRDAAGQAVDLQPPGTVSQTDCSIFGHGLSTALPQWVYDAHASPDGLVLPADDGFGKPLAIELGPSSAMFFQLHIANPTFDPFVARVTLDAQALGAGAAYTKSGSFVTYNQNVQIPGSTIGHLESRTCSTPPGVRFWRLTTRTHGHATQTAIKDVASLVFESSDWSDPGAITFPAPSFFTFSTDKITYQCTYDNNGNNTIVTGEDFATNELCVAVGYFFPATKPRYCLDNLLLP